MKKIKNYALLIMIALGTSMSFTACSDDDENGGGSFSSADWVQYCSANLNKTYSVVSSDLKSKGFTLRSTRKDNSANGFTYDSYAYLNDVAVVSVCVVGTNVEYISYSESGNLSEHIAMTKKSASNINYNNFEGLIMITGAQYEKWYNDMDSYIAGLNSLPKEYLSSSMQPVFQATAYNNEGYIQTNMAASQVSVVCATGHFGK